MLCEYWGFERQPFHTSSESALFLPLGGHDEALARLEFLVTQGRRLAILLGKSGTGKSLLMSTFARQARRRHQTAVFVSLAGLWPEELCQLLAVGLGEYVNTESRPHVLWRVISNKIRENYLLGRKTVVLLDGADRANSSTLEQVLRLVLLGHVSEDAFSVVLSCGPQTAEHLGLSLLERADLRIDLEPWEAEDAASFVRQSLQACGGKPDLFDAAAVELMHQLTAGVPRRLTQLADLSLFAAMASAQKKISAGTVLDAYQELASIQADVSDAEFVGTVVYN